MQRIFRSSRDLRLSAGNEEIPEGANISRRTLQKKGTGRTWQSSRKLFLRSNSRGDSLNQNDAEQEKSPTAVIDSLDCRSKQLHRLLSFRTANLLSRTAIHSPSFDADETERSAEAPRVSSSVDVFYKYQQFWNAHDSVRLLQLLDDSFQATFPNDNYKYNRLGYVKYIQRAFASFPDLKMTCCGAVTPMSQSIHPSATIQGLIISGKHTGAPYRMSSLPSVPAAGTAVQSLAAETITLFEIHSRTQKITKVVVDSRGSIMGPQGLYEALQQSSKQQQQSLLMEGTPQDHLCVQLARKRALYLNSHDLDAYRSIVHPNCIHVFASSNMEVTVTDYLAEMKDVFESFPDLTFEYKAIELPPPRKGENVNTSTPTSCIIRGFAARGTHTGMPYGFGPFPPIPTSNQSVYIEPLDYRIQVDIGTGTILRVIAMDDRNVVSGPPGLYTQIGGFPLD